VYDIAYLRLSRSISSNNIRPVGFGARPRANDVTYVVSLGQSEAGYSAPRLRHARMTALPKCECAREEEGLFAQTNSPDNGTCDRDDGAPVIFRGYLAGLASGKRFACRDRKKEGLFVDISERTVQDFIRGCL